MSPLVSRALQIAASEIGVREEGGRNRGPRVEEYLAAAGLDPGYPWCAAFVYFVFQQAARELDLLNPCPRTGSVHRLWNQAAPFRRWDPVRPGCVFVHDAGKGAGHTGLVESVRFPEAKIITIEGNTDDDGGREGIEVALGYLDFGPDGDEAVA
jgi:hypothetical protein